MEKQNDAQEPQCGQLRDLRRNRARELIGLKMPAVARRSAPIRTHASAREAKNRPVQAHTSAMPILANVGDSRPHHHDKAPLSYDEEEDPKPRPRTHATCNTQYATCYMQRATCNMQHVTCNMQHATCSAVYPLAADLPSKLSKERSCCT